MVNHLFFINIFMFEFVDIHTTIVKNRTITYKTIKQCSFPDLLCASSSYMPAHSHYSLPCAIIFLCSLFEILVFVFCPP